MLHRMFVGIILVAGVSAAVTSREARKAAPGFTLEDSNGASVRLSDYKGRVVLLDFWATTCGGCKVEIPWFIEFQNQFKDSGLAVIGVALDEDGWKVVKPFVKEKQMNYPVVIGNDSLADRFGVTSMPTTLLIDRDGKIAASHTGLVDKSAFESELRTLLQVSPFACNRLTLSDKDRKRHFDELGPMLRTLRKGVRELADGYEFEFPSDPASIQLVAEWAAGEYLCCPFFDIDLRLERENGAFWLRLTGREGVKQFIKSDFARWLPSR
jgi:peroxiredoxin